MVIDKELNSLKATESWQFLRLPIPRLSLANIAYMSVDCWPTLGLPKTIRGDLEDVLLVDLEDVLVSGSGKSLQKVPVSADAGRPGVLVFLIEGDNHYLGDCPWACGVHGRGGDVYPGGGGGGTTSF